MVSKGGASRFEDAGGMAEIIFYRMQYGRAFRYYLDKVIEWGLNKRFVIGERQNVNSTIEALVESGWHPNQILSGLRSTLCRRFTCH